MTAHSEAELVAALRDAGARDEHVAAAHPPGRHRTALLNAEAAAGAETSTVDSSDSDIDPIAAVDALGSDSDVNEAIGRELLEDEEEK